jgi:hypothetical protein
MISFDMPAVGPDRVPRKGMGMKARLLRLSVAAISLVSLVAVLGAGRKW